jgi:predicted ATP-binding protein involved in virulence
MKIHVENLGTLKQGEIALDKNLIIFTGPNHSGKSFLGYLIYGWFKLRESNTSNHLYQKYKETLYHHFEQENIDDKYLSKNGLSVNLLNVFNDNYNLYVKVCTQALSDSIIELFASKDLQPKIQLSGISYQNSSLTTESEQIIQLNGVNYRCRVNHDWFEIKSDSQLRGDLSLIKPYFYEAISFYNGFNSYFFPAERSALNLLSKELVKEKALERDELLRRLNVSSNLEQMVKSLKQNGSLMPRYPLAINDYIYFINDLRHIQQNDSEYATFANDIEKTLMHAKVSVSEFGELQFSPHRRRKPLRLHMSSSLVKSLAGLVIYFRHLARKNDVIIIDEPELNLHPDNQRQVAKILAKAANQGFKIILSTHSDYILKEFNNLIMLSSARSLKLKKNLLKPYGYNKDMILEPHQVEAYFFNNHVIDSVPVTEKGFAVETINEEIDDLENATNNIYFQLFEQ